MSSLKKSSTNSRDHKISKDRCDFIVEKILSRRIRHRKLEYLLKWQGFDETKNSWELAQNLDCQELIKSFERKRGRENTNRLGLRRRNSMVIETKEKESKEIKVEETKPKDLKEMKVKETKTQEIDKENSKDLKTELKKSLKNEEIKIKSNVKKIKNQVKKEINQKKREIINEITANESSTQINVKKEQNKQNSPTNKSTEKSADNLNSYEIINDKYLVSDFLSRDSVVTGFEKGLEVDHILGATNVKGCLYLVLKFHGDDEPQLIVAEIVNKKIPQMVIQFYEKSLSWNSEDEEEEK